ncbi:MAG: hypothetical protein ABI347_07000 [Nitrososphaera sp.]
MATVPAACVMQGIQKAKCVSCGAMFMSENGSKACPSCASGSGSHSHGDMGGGCGCGHHHHPHH